MDRRFLTILAVLVIAFIGIFAVSKNSNNDNSGTKNSSAQPTNHVEGLGQKSVTLVEYGDYQCSVCYAYYPTVKQVTQQFSDQIHFQFRNLPLTSLHPNAFAGARAAEAAGLQGKYWEMHDVLYENQDPSGQTGWVASRTPLDSYFAGYAKGLNLDVNQFKTDYASTKVNDAINADLSAFEKTHQQMATPTFFIDGQYIPYSDLVDPSTGRPSVDKFASVINAEIAKQSKK
jgi:protein-disulfide isomerase